MRQVIRLRLKLIGIITGWQAEGATASENPPDGNGDIETLLALHFVFAHSASHEDVAILKLLGGRFGEARTTTAVLLQADSRCEAFQMAEIMKWLPATE